ncbi:DUF6507 family protein [Streptomyces spiramenti]|uniref:Uncharacterized protein n=1 Tax=Streptomyces spiramenti TaxID=2720606 RepID=A0ABX1AHI6_9ACTN|nr:DUF6507 family protein [Streptomyces spiramenti]NJP65111.1 hypothetical protein [Streptomyces spiramenti]
MHWDLNTDGVSGVLARVDEQADGLSQRARTTLDHLDTAHGAARGLIVGGIAERSPLREALAEFSVRAADVSEALRLQVDACADGAARATAAYAVGDVIMEQWAERAGRVASDSAIPFVLNPGR